MSSNFPQEIRKEKIEKQNTANKQKKQINKIIWQI